MRCQLHRGNEDPVVSRAIYSCFNNPLFQYVDKRERERKKEKKREKKNS